jgi:hypothetical protein
MRRLKRLGCSLAVALLSVGCGGPREAAGRSHDRGDSHQHRASRCDGDDGVSRVFRRWRSHVAAEEQQDHPLPGDRTSREGQRTRGLGEVRARRRVPLTQRVHGQVRHRQRRGAQRPHGAERRSHEGQVGPKSEVFEDKEHITRAAMHLTLLQRAKTTLTEVIAKASAKQPGTVYSVTP